MLSTEKLTDYYFCVICPHLGVFRLPYQLAISNMLLPDGINLNPSLFGVAGIIVIFQQL